MAASLQDQLDRMRLILQDLEGRLEAGEVGPESLPEFKSMVDDIRLRLWAVLASAGAEAPRTTAERFRLRRAVDFCRALTHELTAGQLGVGHPEWPEVQETAAQLSATIAAHTTRAA
jgi:hypothetical protein